MVRSGIQKLRKAVPFLPALAFVGLPLATITAVASTGVPVTGTAVAGVLTAVYPASIALNSTTAGVSTNLALNVSGGAIVVADARGASCGTWTTSATMSNFTDVATGTHTISSSSLSMSPGTVINVGNLAGMTATAGADNQVFTTTSTAVTFMSATGTGTGGCGTFGLNPTFTWAVPANAFSSGLGIAYSGTMTFTTQ